MARIVAAGSQELRGLHVFESCRHFIRTRPVLPRDPTDPDDLDTRAEDHLADGRDLSLRDAMPS